jgi:hypothetical protein
MSWNNEDCPPSYQDQPKNIREKAVQTKPQGLSIIAKIFPFLLVSIICLLTACSKGPVNPNNSVPATTTIKYGFTADISDTYMISYYDARDSAMTETVVGATWSKSFTVVNHAGFKSAFIEVLSHNPSKIITSATVTISANGQLKATSTRFTTPSSGLVNMVGYELPK